MVGLEVVVGWAESLAESSSVVVEEVTLVGRMGAPAVPVEDVVVVLGSSVDVGEVAVVRTMTTVVGDVTVVIWPLRDCVTVTVSVVVYSFVCTLVATDVAMDVATEVSTDVAIEVSTVVTGTTAVV